ncbi:hypothetical protein INR49_010415, partial [Caranx melampygus]
VGAFEKQQQQQQMMMMMMMMMMVVMMVTDGWKTLVSGLAASSGYGTNTPSSTVS